MIVIREFNRTVKANRSVGFVLSEKDRFCSSLKMCNVSILILL